MTAQDYIINILLIAIVFRQIRGRKISPVMFLLPIILVSYFAAKYVHFETLAGNDMALILVLTGAGLLLGSLCAVYTHVYRDTAGTLGSKATTPAAILWVLGIGARVAFSIYATHGGGPVIARFSMAHQITSQQTWINGLLLMAFGEVAARTIGVGLKAWKKRSSGISTGLAAAAGN